MQAGDSNQQTSKRNDAEHVGQVWKSALFSRTQMVESL